MRAEAMGIENAAILVFALYIIGFVSLVFFLIIFPLWMFIHACILTIKTWPEYAARNVLLVLLVFVTACIGAVVYYFTIYRKSKILDFNF